VTRLTRHIRPLVAALAVVALGAGTALAGPARPSTGSMPDAAAPGLQRAAEAAGKTVPVAAPAAGADQDEAGEAPETEPSETESPETDQAGAPTADHPANHGADVSKAAQVTTPPGFDNHGQYVRSVATANHGQTVSAGHANPASNGSRPNH
jgi:hypothetical protein